MPISVPLSPPFKSFRRAKPPFIIVIHESVSTTAEATIATLRRKNLGVHVMIDEAAQATQLGPFDRGLDHAKGFRSTSVGFEVVNPYYPKFRPEAGPWGEPIKAPWAHEGRYVPATKRQCAALWVAIKDVCGETGIPLAFPFAIGRVVSMARVGDIKTKPGIQAHGHTDHADGWFPALYCYLSHLGVEAPYENALTLATGARGSVRIPEWKSS